MRKNKNTSTSRASVWSPDDIRKAGKMQTRTSGRDAKAADHLYHDAHDDVIHGDFTSRSGGGHVRLVAQIDNASPTNSETPASEPVGSGHDRWETPSVPATPTPNAAPAAGESQACRENQPSCALPDTNAPRKRGRPRKAIVQSQPAIEPSSGSLISETPEETPVGGGHDRLHNQSDDASPAPEDGSQTEKPEHPITALSASVTDSVDQAREVLSPMDNMPDDASPPAPRKRGRPRRASQAEQTTAVLPGEPVSQIDVQQDVDGGDQAKGPGYPTAAMPDPAPQPDTAPTSAVSDAQAIPRVDPSMCLPDVATPSSASTGGRQRRTMGAPNPSLPLSGAAPKPARRGRPPRQANALVSTVTTSPAVAQIADPAQPAGGGQYQDDNHVGFSSPDTNTASNAVSSDPTMTILSPSECESDAAPLTYKIGDGGSQVTHQCVLASPEHERPELAPIVAELQELQRKRIFCIKSQMRQQNATLALLRALLGWQFGATEAENAKINKRAREVVKDVETRHRLELAAAALGALPDDAPSKEMKAAQKEYGLAVAAVKKLKPLEGRELTVSVHYGRIIVASAQANAPWDLLRDEHEARMRELTKQLPVYDWMLSVRGFGEIGLAKIIGEAGDLSKYSNPAKLWKRLGLAVINGRRQGDPGPGASAEDWTEHGYNPKRRSEVWNITDTLIRGQWRGAKEDDETGEITDGYPLGRYGEIYAARKAYEQQRNELGLNAEAAAAIVARTKSKGKGSPENLEGRLTRKHIDSRTRRYVAKKLVKHLWQRWRNPDVQETDEHVPALEQGQTEAV